MSEPARTDDVAPAASAQPLAVSRPLAVSGPLAVSRPKGVAARSRGVTGRGVVVLIAAATLLAGLLDLAISGHRGHLFGIAFAIASGAGAFVVRRRDVPTAMIAPPLLYCVLIAVMSLVDQQGGSGSLSTREGLYLGTAFVTGAPAIWTGTAAAGLIGWYRLRKGR